MQHPEDNLTVYYLGISESIIGIVIAVFMAALLNNNLIRPFFCYRFPCSLIAVGSIMVSMGIFSNSPEVTQWGRVLQGGGLILALMASVFVVKWKMVTHRKV